ncbi:hypothetical protein GPJ56_000127 [Histomonas meleagridis]|uniref:uncharacterized protein n=1 Tax=Histomonas meleagridis TaxID=135588 RepID=UPI00355A5AC1|nr:hypothetical protein GPJ56_000127 [Histomonas meleagridis]KAH0805626.1 hypothetical protein GO595_001681 [Histomonas meleagridis]
MLAQKRSLELNLIKIGMQLPVFSRNSSQPHSTTILGQNDEIIVLGSPHNILKNSSLLPSNPLIFVTIPFESYIFRSSIWKHPVSFKGFGSLCFPFVPYKEYIRIPIGTFESLFISEGIFEVKALKGVLSCLEFVFGPFSRVYGVGKLSSEISQGFLNNNINHNARNMLILFDRSIDLLSMSQVNTSYIGLIEEFCCWDSFENSPTFESIAKILNVSTTETRNMKMFKSNDPTFDELLLMPITEALQSISNLDIRSTESERLQKEHMSVIQNIIRVFKNTFDYEVLTRIQNKEKNYDPKVYGRVLALDERTKLLGFRLLTILQCYGMKSEAESIARVLAFRHSLRTFAKWNQLDQFLSDVQIQIPDVLKSYPNKKSLSKLAAALSLILTREKKETAFPIKPNYFSNSDKIPSDKQRWFVVTIGGMTLAELWSFKKVASICRPNDEFVFLTTKLTAPNEFMAEIIE